MMREHASALAREEYEYLHDGNGMTNEQIKREAQISLYGISRASISSVADSTPDASGTCMRMEPCITIL